MLKAASTALLLLFFCLPVAFADLSNVKQTDIVKAINSPILKQAEIEDSPGCNATHYTFGDMVFSTKVEFKCDRIIVAWTGSRAPANKERTEHAIEIAQKAVAALTQSNGIEVRKVVEGGKYKDRVFENGLRMSSGYCSADNCLLTFK